MARNKLRPNSRMSFTLLGFSFPKRSGIECQEAGILLILDIHLAPIVIMDPGKLMFAAHAERLCRQPPRKRFVPNACSNARSTRTISPIRMLLFTWRLPLPQPRSPAHACAISAITNYSKNAPAGPRELDGTAQTTHHGNTTQVVMQSKDDSYRNLVCAGCGAVLSSETTETLCPKCL